MSEIKIQCDGYTVTYQGDGPRGDTIHYRGAWSFWLACGPAASDESPPNWSTTVAHVNCKACLEKVPGILRTQITSRNKAIAELQKRNQQDDKDIAEARAKTCPNLDCINGRIYPEISTGDTLNCDVSSPCPTCQS